MPQVSTCIMAAWCTLACQPTAGAALGYVLCVSRVGDLVARLEVPPGPPPITVVTQLQSLPFGDLRWDDFERLCLRLARSDHEVEDARRYGIPGQDQYGIDLFARRVGTGGYTVYQCKKVERFGPSDIGAAIDDFLEGRWANQADRFVLCTSVSLAPTRLADRLEMEKERMAGRGIVLKTWDADELDILMKDHPALVDDFFGRAAVTAFCGPGTAADLGQRLDGRQVAEYRRRLHNLYAAVFTQLDPGLPVPPGVSDAPVDLRRRYVVPDVMEATEDQVIQGTVGPRAQSAGRQLDAPLGSGPKDEAPGVPDAARTSPGDAAYRLRQPLGTWLVSSQRCLLVGGRGSGKSAALRFVTLDLLDENPQLADVTGHWGGRLPVWVSFPYWTSLIAREPEGVSLPDCVRRWLGAYGQAELWPLVEQALADDRLLLIVDGLDEWITENAARTAAHLLQVYVQADGIPVLAAGRPHGVRRLELRGGRWNVAEIAELDARQQHQVARVWAQIRLTAADGESPPADDLRRLADEESSRFIEQVRAAVHLGQLAQNPMLLMLLLYLHLRHADLPSNRFDAYEKVIGHLIADHPAARRLAAFSADLPPLQPAAVRHALAYLAYRLQRERSSSDVEDSLAARYVEDALGSVGYPGLGLPSETATATAASILATAEEGFGLLVRTGAGTVRFFHRAIQEHLAAVHLTRLPPAEQCNLVAEVGSDPRWEPAILSLMWLAPRPTEVEALLGSLPHAVAGPAGEQRDRIRAEAAFGPFDTTAGWAQTVAVQTIAAVEQGERLAHQGQLLDRVLAGIDNPRTSRLVSNAIGQWVYDRAISRAATVAAVAAWPTTPETWHVLTVALNDSDNYVQRAAGNLIPRIYGGDQQARDLVFTAAKSSQRSMTRAAALNALTRGWPEDPAAQKLTAWARQSVAAELVVAAIDAAVQRGITADDDFRQLVSLVSGGWRYPSSPWIDAIPEILRRGWAGSEELRDMCLDGAARQWEHGKGIKKSVATALLAAAFPGDDRVADWIAGELDHAQHPFLMAWHPATWKSIATNFRDHPVVADAARRWIPGQQFRDLEVSLLALVSRTGQMRDLLISRLASASFPHWEADNLLEGWGMQDTAVAEALHGFLDDRPPAESAKIAHLVPQIIEDPGQARAALLAMLRAPGVTRPDLVLSGLAKLTEPGDVTEIVAAAEPHLNGGLSDPFTELIAGFPQHPRVRELAIAALDKHDAPVGAVTHAYASDPEMRLLAARALAPVSPPLRARTISTLARRPLSDTATTALLDQFDVERHGDVKVAAATAWARRIRHDQQAATRALERLTSLVQATGPDHDERRRAAFAALLVLGRADVFIGLRQPFGNAEPLRVSPDLLHHDIEFVRLVAEHWSTLTEMLGDELSTRLSVSGDAITFWTAMCAVAAAYPDIQPDVLRAIDTNPHVAASTQALRFTAAARAGTPALLDQLFAVIDAANGPSTSRGNLEQALFAADTIARQFAGRPETAAQLVDRPLSRWELGRVAALCRGWPDHPAVRDLYQPAPIGPPIWADRELRYALLPPRQLIAEIRKDIGETIQTGEDQTFLVTGPLSARLRRDSEAVQAFEGALDANTDPVMKAAIPSALGMAGALTQPAVDWCAAEIERQSANGSTDLGFDLRTGIVRGVAITLIDVLQGSSV